MPFALGGIELGGLALAFFAFLLCCGVSYMLVAIGKAIEATSIPVVSSGLASIWRTITQPVVNLLVAATNALWSDVEWWGRGIAWLSTTLFDDIRDAFVWDGQQIDHLFTQVIPNAAKTVEGSAARFANQQITALQRDISDSVTTIEHAASGEALRALAEAEAFAKTIRGDLTKLVAHDVTVAEKYADARLADAKAYVDSAISSIHLPSLESLGAAPAALVGTVAGIGAAVVALTKEFEECAVTNCEGPNQLSSLLPSLLGLVGIGSLVAFLEQAISNPAGVEAQYAAQFAQLASGLVGGGVDIGSYIESVVGL